jgi:KipI family sensor histidine kinase inhibitor
MTAAAPTFVPLGDSALQIVFGDRIDPVSNRRALALSRALAGLPGIGDRVPAYASLTLHYDPLLWTLDDLTKAIEPYLASAEDAGFQGALVTVPVCYGGELGPDLEALARLCAMSAEEVIARHAAPEYRVHFLGFTPGFPYLGGLDPALAAPRHATPRALVPAGAVGIAGAQTGIYPQAGPGGWQIIGRTPLRLFDPRREPPCLLAPGDRLRFAPIGPEEFVCRYREANP